MKERSKREIATVHLLLSPYDPAADLSGGVQAVAESLHAAANEQSGGAYAHLLVVRDKKSGKLIGAVRSFDASSPRTAEIDLQLYAVMNGERIAAEALKGAARWLFAAHKDLLVIETWLNPALSAIRILERAGFERFFEKEGVVRYERHRPHFPFMIAIMLFFTALGILFGRIFGNYPLYIAAGVAAGVAPGAIVERLAQKRKSRERK